MDDEQRYFVYLVVCAILDIQPDEPTAELDWKKVYNVSTEQSLFAAFYHSLQKIKSKPGDEVLAKMKKIYMQSLNLCIRKDYISQEAVKLIADGSVNVLPLKGFYIKEYYWRKEFRYVSDLDIYTDNVKKAVKILLSDGFEQVKDDIHHVVLSKNNFAVEVHKTLFVGKYKDLFLSPFENCFNPVSNKYIFRMKNNYFYAFFIAHCAYHFMNGGIGLRSICDIYLINRHLKITDKSLIEKCGLSEFEKVLSEFAADVFSFKEYDRELMEVVLSSHTNGDDENNKKIDVASKGRSTSLIRRIFPSYEYMSTAYDIKNRSQLPLFWLKRFAKNTHNKTQAAESLISHLNVTKGEEEKYKRVLSKLGLSGVSGNAPVA